jgi:acetoin utilization deacetylase AcuC-like enzyme
MSSAMATALIYHDRFLDHDTGPNHPERPDRLRAIKDQLQVVGLWDRLIHLSFEPADLVWVGRVHDSSYLDRLSVACRAHQPFIDTVDSAICAASFDIAQLAVGGALAAADAVMADRVRNVFCALRPPGHHAECDCSMGFCLFNNIAITAHYLIERHNLERVAIVDFDVHHGNGTQHIFEDRADVLFISLHEDPASLYPGTGFARETGRGDGAGTTINVPLAPSSGDDAYQAMFKEKVLPALRRFDPQVLLISAGFDAAQRDPLAHLAVTEDGFRWMTVQLKSIAAQCCNGRMLCLLEGGYDLKSLAESVALHIEVLLADD